MRLINSKYFPVLRSVLLICAGLISQPIQAQGFDTAKIEQITGLKGKYSTGEGVFKVTSPRSDVAVEVDGWRMPPFMGLTSWVSFCRDGKAEGMIMGDIVLFEDEVNAVMSAALDNGLKVTALHNHFFYSKPNVFFMHIGGEGKFEQLASGVRKVFDEIKKIRAAGAAPASSFGGQPLPAQNSIDGIKIEKILGVKGQSQDGMFKVVIGHKVNVAGGFQIGKEMGVNTWAAFAGSDENALVDGDFTVTENELQPVLKALRQQNINIVAIHNHMTGENPRMIFLHYWGKGSAQDLAKALKEALAARA